jgi:hypothetical protein
MSESRGVVWRREASNDPIREATMPGLRIRIGYGSKKKRSRTGQVLT